MPSDHGGLILSGSWRLGALLSTGCAASRVYCREPFVREYMEVSMDLCLHVACFHPQYDQGYCMECMRYVKKRIREKVSNSVICFGTF